MRILNDVDLILVLDVGRSAKIDWVDVQELVGVHVLQVCISQFDDREIQLWVCTVSNT